MWGHTSNSVLPFIMKTTLLHPGMFKPIDQSNSSMKHHVQWFQNPIKTTSLLVCSVNCFSGMLLCNVHKSIIVMNSPDTRFFRNVFEAVQKLAARILSSLKPDKTLLLAF